jgi:hypothetical protein
MSHFMNGQAKVKGWCKEEDSLISWVNNFSKKKKEKQYLQNSNESNSKLELYSNTIATIYDSSDKIPCLYIEYLPLWEKNSNKAQDADYLSPLDNCNWTSFSISRVFC